MQIERFYLGRLTHASYDPQREAGLRYVVLASMEFRDSNRKIHGSLYRSPPA